MMSRTLNLPEGPTGQVLAVAAAAIMLAIFWLALLTPLLGWYGGQSSALAAAQLEAAHLQALQASLPELRRQAAARATEAPAADILLQGDSDAIAGANLQAALNSLAAQAGTTLDSTESVPASASGGLRRIGVTVSLNATWPALVAFLTAIDAASPRMIVDDLTVSADSAPDARQDVTLQASFTVAAFRAGAGP
jgi:general secretion pathway protein M